MQFLPTSNEEIKKLGWKQPDIIIVSGDAYVDHSSFGTAVIARLAESKGLKVAVLPQPNWRDDLRDFKKLGPPALFFGVTAGCMDSMVNHYTALKRKRSNDSYTPGGRAGYRPDYACTVYTRILKQIYPDVPVVLGGIEASLRRLTHYDYWSDSIMPSILVDSGADILLYGMAEQAFSKLIDIILKQEFARDKIELLNQVAFVVNQQKYSNLIKQQNSILLPSHEECASNKKKFAEAFKLFEENSNPYFKKNFIQKIGMVAVVITPPFLPQSAEQNDVSYDLPYTRLPHPRYRNKPPIPAYEMIKNSITTHRGCFGGCSFCAISAHQGRFVASRTKDSILNEVKRVAEMQGFSGHITDLGGPSANMYNMSGINSEICKKCKRVSCIFPSICKNLNFNHLPLVELYAEASKVKNVKKITIGSGIRYDLLVAISPTQDILFGLSEYTEQLISKHVSGRLKVAPEHISPDVLNLMRKPTFDKLELFYKQFKKINQKYNKNQQLVVYLIAGHPACDLNDMEFLARKIAHKGLISEQIQEFTPTPMTLSTTIFYTGINPYTGEKVSVYKSINEIRKQKEAISAITKKRK